MESSIVSDILMADIGGFIAPSVVNRVIVETVRDFCRFSMALHSEVSTIINVTDIDAAKNYAASMALPNIEACEAFAIFGLTINGEKVACVERSTNRPLGACALSHTGGIFFEISDITTCSIHPLSSGGDIYFYAAFMPTNQASAIPDQLWNKYSDGLCSGMKAKLLLMAGYSTSNHNMASAFAAEFKSAKRIARADVNRKIIGERLCC